MKRRTSGEFTGRYREGEGDPEEVNASVEIESDPVAGVVRTRIRETEDEIRSHRAAMAVAFLQGRLLSDAQRRRHASRPIVPVPKPAGKRRQAGAIPAGFAVCPDCGSGLTDVWDCARCEGRGIIRAASNRREEEGQS